jgi:hypothetical protein
LLTENIALYKNLRGLLKCQEDYVPTIAGISETKDTRTGIREYQLSMDSVPINIISVSGQCPSYLSKKDQYPNINEWTHQFENATSIVYFVALGCSDDETIDNQLRV